jgi:tRNA A-37 threonylcarbamoyl transferase component Bud32
VLAGRYRLLSLIGSGGMGTVWRARDELLDRDVAVKEVKLRTDITDEERAVLQERTKREARATARLNHPGIITVHDVVEEDGRPWIVMEYVAAGSLQEIIEAHGPLPVPEVAEIGRQMLSALRAAHAAGILHRDVKPANVLLLRDGPEPRAVLTDFGLAQMAGDVTLTQTGLVMGSPAYIAPERARGEKAGPPADLWALGATLYAGVEGRPPHDRSEVMAALAAVLYEDPPPPRNAGPLSPLLLALLDREATRRPTLEAAADHLATLTGRSTSGPRQTFPAAPTQPTPGQVGATGEPTPFAQPAIAEEAPAPGRPAPYPGAPPGLVAPLGQATLPGHPVPSADPSLYADDPPGQAVMPDPSLYADDSPGRSGPDRTRGPLGWGTLPAQGAALGQPGPAGPGARAGSVSDGEAARAAWEPQMGALGYGAEATRDTTRPLDGGVGRGAEARGAEARGAEARGAEVRVEVAEPGTMAVRSAGSGRRRGVWAAVAAVAGVATVLVGVVLVMHWSSAASPDGRQQGSTQPARPPATKQGRPLPPLPVGWTVARQPGYTIYVPRGWQQRVSGQSVFWLDPKTDAYLQVDATPWGNETDPSAHWRTWLTQVPAGGHLKGFKQLTQIQQVVGEPYQAAELQFTYLLRPGAVLHAFDRGVLTDDERQFAILFAYPDKLKAFRGVANTILASFRPR